MDFKNYLQTQLESIKKQNLHRKRIILKENIIDFSSNDYLGLKNCKKTKEALKKAIEKLHLSSGASPLVSGYTEVQKQLEEALAKLKKTERCLVVGSGYLANTGLIPALASQDSIIFSDELNHASIIDGIRLSKAKKCIYKHADMNHLEDLLKKHKSFHRKFIITDGVFSMEGDIAPLKEIKFLADKYSAVVIIDDAHATGVIGEGRGSLFHYNLQPDENIVQMGTLSKAIGSYGAFICGTKLLIEFLVNTMRTQIFSTALSPIQNFISLYNLKVSIRQPSRRHKVFELVKYTISLAKELNLPISHKGTPILTLITGSEKKALFLRDYLLKKGFFLQAIRPPTVPKNTSRLRLTLNYNINKRQIKKMLKTLKEALHEVEK